MNFVEGLLAVVATATGIAAAVFLIRLALLQKRHESVTQELMHANAALARLKPLQQILDADAEARRIVDEAGAERQRVLQAADEALWNAEVKARERLSEADRDAEKQRTAGMRERDALVAQGDQALSIAHDRARWITRQAEAEARKTAGRAWKVAGKASELKKVAEAMRNRIEGYGSSYLRPNAEVLEELADDFDHAAAGKGLKTVQRQSKELVDRRAAAYADVKSPEVRRIAEDYVLAYFNAKVDGTLRKVKIGNIGTLSQEIEDAYQLANHMGRRLEGSPRITPKYRVARLEELRWGVMVLEFQKRAREEQRAIREQMREEERARREYERAIEEAEKEERQLEKAMREAEAKLAAAGEAQRAEYEAQLAELRSKLADAESREQRAKSLAEQTRRGHVYVISNLGSFGEHVYKIGLTRRLDPLDRVKELGDASVPFSFDVHALIYSDDAPALEAELHRRFGDSRLNRVNHRKEFFRVSIAEIRTVIEDMDLEVHWTMAAEATEWRESLAAAEASQADLNGAHATAGAATGDLLDFD